MQRLSLTPIQSKRNFFSLEKLDRLLYKTSQSVQSIVKLQNSL